MKTPSNRRIPCLSTLLLAVLLGGCGNDNAPGGNRAGAGAGAMPGAPLKVGLRPVEAIQWVDEIEALGTTQANESLTITAKVTETVQRVNFVDGEQVESGAVLVELTGAGEVAALKEAQSAYAEANKQYTRFAGLVEQGTITRAQLDTQTAMRDQARARTDAIRARLSDRVITAPFAGVLGFRQVSQGTLVTPGTAITTLDDVSVLKLDFSVPEIYLGSINVGAQVNARSTAFAGETFFGTVRSIGSRVDPLTRAVTVRAHLDNASGRLKPGMLLTVRLATPPRETLVLDEIALIQTGSQAFVYRVGADSVAQRVNVKIGARKDGRVEVIEGLAAGDQIVAEGVVKLRPGMKVQAVPAEGQAAPAEPAMPAAG